MFGFESNENKEYTSNAESVNHASDLLKAASPYLTADLRKSLDLFVKTFEFTSAIKGFNSSSVKSQSFESQKNIDFEGLLKSIRPLCTKEEAEMVDIFLNMFSATNFYRTYKEMTSLFATQSGSGEGQADDAFGSSMGNQQMFDTLAEMLPPEQKSTFETMKVLMESGMLNQMFSQSPT